MIEFHFPARHEHAPVLVIDLQLSDTQHGGGRGSDAEDVYKRQVTAYFNGMFEVVRHNMDRAAAHRYVKMLNDYHMAGFGTVFDPQP